MTRRGRCLLLFAVLQLFIISCPVRASDQNYQRLRRVAAHDPTQRLKTTKSLDQDDPGLVVDRINYEVILGGNTAEIHSKPYMVALASGYFGEKVNIVCGGTIIAPQIILTAAHCVSAATPVEAIAVGRHDLSAEDETTGQIVSKADFKVFWSSHYTDVASGYDYGFVLLKEPLDMQSLEMATINRDPTVPPPSSSVLALGWGMTEDGGVSAVLREADMTYLSNGECSNRWETWPDFPTTMCAIYDVGSVCFGDSGGPLVVEGEGVQGGDDVLVGLTSFVYGLECSQAHYNGFARVAEQVDWITSNVCFHSESPPEDFDCDQLPYLTVVVEGTEATVFDVSLEILEPTTSADWLRVIDAPGLSVSGGERFETKIYLYPGNSRTREYMLFMEPKDGTLSKYEIWEGDPGTGQLKVEEEQSPGYTYAFEFDDSLGARTFSPSTSPSMAPSLSMIPTSVDEVAPSTGPYLRIVLKFDDYADEISWVVYEVPADGTLNIIDSVDPGAYSGSDGDTTVVYVPLTVGADGSTFEFYIYDSYGDGLCCFEPGGSYTLTYFNADLDRQSVGSGGGDFGYSDSAKFTVGGSISLAPPPPDDIPDSDTKLALESSAAPNLCVDVAFFSQRNGALLLVWGCHRRENQLFRLFPLDDGTYWIKAVHSDKCISVAGPSRGGQAGFIIQFQCQDRALMKWTIETEDFDDGFKLRNESTDGCLTLHGGSSRRGSRLWTTTCSTDAITQKWDYVAVE